MASWRDTTPQATQNDMDLLLSTALDVAQRQLADKGALAPFGVVADDHGIALRGIAPGGAADTVEVLDELYDGIRLERSDLRGAAVVIDVRLPSGSDAVQVHVEHADPQAPALVLALPYAGAGDDLTYGSLAAAADRPRIWT